MRTKSKVRKRSSVPGWVYSLLGYVFISGLIVFHLSAFIFKLSEISNLFPAYSITPWQELSILTGGPALILLSLASSFRSRKLAGALLLLGTALISLGLAYQSGYFLKTYLIRMAILGVPQLLAGVFFLKAGKGKPKNN
jgi:hypothetical protein